MALLRAHGWVIKPGGADTCERPGRADDECGGGVLKGAQLRFNEQISPGDAAALNERASWSRAGIQVILTDFDLVDESRRVKAPSCAWQLAAGGGWLYPPNYLPTGEYLWLSSSPWNEGSYRDAHNDALILSSLSSGADTAGLDAWEEYLGRQLPVIWQPVQDTLAEVRTDMIGVTMDPFGDLTRSPGIASRMNF